MISRSSKNRNELLSEIRVAEGRRATKLQNEIQLSEWVKNFRNKYIVDGFLTPLYTWDGRDSRRKKRIAVFGDFIQPYKMVGKVFDKDVSRGWIRQESLWFWQYLMSGQEIIFSRELSKLPNHVRVDDMPENIAPEDTSEIAKWSQVSGELLLGQGKAEQMAKEILMLVKGPSP